MAKKSSRRTFDEALSLLSNHQFDVGPALEGAKGVARAVRVTKRGCAAEIAPAADGTPEILVRPGWVLNGSITRLLDRGYQKFLQTDKLEIPATADRLHAIHEFSEELKETLGGISLYNESLGTTSDVYLYDRVNGRK
ncbi:MAG: hypothetical protein FWD64_12830 [Acidobacteriaceae bacterium]|nr:hypothetical protein [Acidobacteriaceae bacterium]